MSLPDGRADADERTLHSFSSRQTSRKCYCAFNKENAGSRQAVASAGRSVSRLSFMLNEGVGGSSGQNILCCCCCALRGHKDGSESCGCVIYSPCSSLTSVGRSEGNTCRNIDTTAPGEGAPGPFRGAPAASLQCLHPCCTAHWVFEQSVRMQCFD